MLADILAHTSSINCINFSPDGNFIATASYDKTAKIFSVAAFPLPSWDQPRNTHDIVRKERGERGK